MIYAARFETMNALLGLSHRKLLSGSAGEMCAATSLRARPPKGRKVESSTRGPPMKRMHVHVSVERSTTSVAFYSALFAAQPSVVKPDYAKWMLDDPRVNFAISTRGRQPGLDHLGIQVESPDELQEVYARLHRPAGDIFEQGQTSCCYAKSEKSWIDDPAGISWETFHTTGESTDYGRRQRGTRPARCSRKVLLRACRQPRLPRQPAALHEQLPWPTIHSMCCFSAPAIRPARSWPRRS